MRSPGNEPSYRLALRHFVQQRIHRLDDQPLQVLAMLVDQAGEMVTREELRRRLWPTDTFVDFDHGLNNAINRLRDALNDSTESQRFIETLPRRGYRFIAELEFLPEPDR